MLRSALRKPVQSRWPTGIPTVCVVDPQANRDQDFESLAAAKELRVEVVATPAAALRLARTTAVDLWVINTELPGLSGFELCSMLKSRPGHSPVYLMADEYSPTAERSAFAARATAFGCRSERQPWIAKWLDHRRITQQYVA